jgi:hypothetical protein
MLGSVGDIDVDPCTIINRKFPKFCHRGNIGSSGVSIRWVWISGTIFASIVSVMIEAISVALSTLLLIVVPDSR